MDKQTAKSKITEHQIPQTTVAKLAGVYKQDVSSFCADLPVAQKRVDLIITAVTELTAFIESLPFPPDFRPEAFGRLRDEVGTYRIKHLREVGVEKVREEFGVVVQPEAAAARE